MPSSGADRPGSNPCSAADQPRQGEHELSVWSGDDIRAFLTATADDREAPLWRLLLATGMRRGEALGLRWSDIDLARNLVNVRQTRSMVGAVVETGTPKTRAGSRAVSLDPATTAVLRAFKRRQAEERLLIGEWKDDTGLVGVEADGSPIHPQVLTRRFKAATKRATAIHPAARAEALVRHGSNSGRRARQGRCRSASATRTSP